MHIALSKRSQMSFTTDIFVPVRRLAAAEPIAQFGSIVFSGINHCSAGRAFGCQLRAIVERLERICHTTARAPVPTPPPQLGFVQKDGVACVLSPAAPFMLPRPT